MRTKLTLDKLHEIHKSAEGDGLDQPASISERYRI